MPALFDFKGYDNFILAEKIESILLTKMDMNRYMTLDESLTQEPGMVKKIHTYVPSGEAEVLARGEGLTNWIDAEYTEREYRVDRNQAGTMWYLDDLMTDPTLIEAKIDGVAESMVNKWTSDAVREMGKTTNQSEMTNWDASDFADAIDKFESVFESDGGLFIVAAINLKAKLKKVLGDDLKYVDNYIEKGYVNTLMGVPLYFSKAIPKDMAFLMTKDAITAFVKKNTFVEQDHDINTKLDRMVAAKYAVIALTDERKCIALGKKNAQDTTITTKAAGAAVVAGAAPTGATVIVYVNGKQFGAPVVAAGNAYSVTGFDNLVVNDAIRVVAHLDGFLNGVATDIAE
jgi:hypothetical protein